jgi:anti-sigma factor RsiW
MTRSDGIFDDQVLGSFVDGLLDAASSEKIIKAMEDDPEIRECIYQLRRAKDLMRLGFGEVSAPSGHTARAKFRHWKLF